MQQAFTLDVSVREPFWAARSIGKSK